MKILADKIDGGSREQARGLDRISQSMHDMERVTQSNAASAEQTAASAQQLTAQASLLQGVVEQLAALSNAA